MSKLQMIKSGADAWDLHQCTARDGVTEFELVGRIVRTKEAWFVDRPVWQDVGHYWERIPREFITWQAALKHVTEFDKRAS